MSADYYERREGSGMDLQSISQCEVGVLPCRVSNHRACGQGVCRLVAPYCLSCQLNCLRGKASFRTQSDRRSVCLLCIVIHALGNDSMHLGDASHAKLPLGKL